MPITIQPTTLKYRNGNTFTSADCIKGEDADPSVLINDTAGSGDYDETWSADKLNTLNSTVTTLSTTVSGKYAKPSGGIPSSDMTSSVQTSLGKADTAYQKPSGGIPATDIASGVIPDISGKADKTDTVLETTLSCGRKADTTVGTNSIAFGYDVTASGMRSQAYGMNTKASGSNSLAEGYGGTASGKYSFAHGYGGIASGEQSHTEGKSNYASGNSSHAEGNETLAQGANSHAEGGNTAAYGTGSHAEGSYSTANGYYAHAEGFSTNANGYYSHSEGYETTAQAMSHVFGRSNIPDNLDNWSEWTANTSYAVGDRVKISSGQNVGTYQCLVANSDSSFTRGNWRDLYGAMNYVEMVGNGFGNDAAPTDRSNARTLDWDGNERLKGNVYVGCNADSTGGTRLPHDVQVNGTSVVTNGVANVPVAGSSQYGVVKINNTYGLNMGTVGGESIIVVQGASNDNIKAGVSAYRPIVAEKQHQAVFYGLAKASGDTSQSSSSNAVGVYTESALSSIHQMLDAPVTVSGSTPSITAKAGVRYVCGEVATLTITVPSSGCIDVVFESGSTATVLTVTPPTGVAEILWANEFDPDNIDADTVYEINILDGKYGVVGTWA